MCIRIKSVYAQNELGAGVTGRIPSATLLGHYDGNSIVGTISSTFGTEASVHQMEVKSGTFRADRIIYPRAAFLVMTYALP
jgi:hypothetical protein